MFDYLAYLSIGLFIISLTQSNKISKEAFNVSGSLALCTGFALSQMWVILSIALIILWHEIYKLNKLLK